MDETHATYVGSEDVVHADHAGGQLRRRVVQDDGIHAVPMGGGDQLARSAAHPAGRRSCGPQSWLEEAREADQLLLLAGSFPEAAAAVVATRPLLTKASEGDRQGLKLELAQEQICGKAADRACWAPLLAELEGMRRAQRGADR